MAKNLFDILNIKAGEHGGANMQPILMGEILPELADARRKLATMGPYTVGRYEQVSYVNQGSHIAHRRICDLAHRQVITPQQADEMINEGRLSLADKEI